MNNSETLGYWVKRFLLDHLIVERNLSQNTQNSYRDMLVLLLPFAAQQAGISVDELQVSDLNAERIKGFLLHLEKERKCSISTRNQRLAGIHALARFIGLHSPEHLTWCQQVRNIASKKGPRPSMSYLEKVEMDALLDVPDRRSAQGRRDYALLLFLYNTGARADEAAQAKIGQLQLQGTPAIRIEGKGRKTRLCPLWLLTKQVLEPLTNQRASDAPIFLNRRNEPITRFGIRTVVRRHAITAATKVPSIGDKQVSVHTIRHTTAMHLLRAGVDINTIRAWLGHVSLDTTHVYAEADLEMKARALEHCEIVVTRTTKEDWRASPELMAFLKSL